MYIIDIDVNDGRKLTFLKVYPSLKTHFLFYSNHLALWQSFPDITHIKVYNGLKLTILNLIRIDIFQGISLPETEHFCFIVMIYLFGMACQISGILMSIMTDSRPF